MEMFQHASRPRAGTLPAGQQARALTIVAKYQVFLQNTAPYTHAHTSTDTSTHTHTLPLSSSLSFLEQLKLEIQLMDGKDGDTLPLSPLSPDDGESFSFF